MKAEQNEESPSLRWPTQVAYPGQATDVTCNVDYCPRAWKGQPSLANAIQPV
jgi:hypothetical protein